MKKLLFMAALGFSAAGFSQLNTTLEAGYAMSNLMVKPELGENYDAKHGYYAGIGLERKWGERIALQLDAQYANIGSRISAEDGGSKATLTWNRHELITPLVFRYYVTYELGVYAGGFLGTKIGNNVKIKGSENIPQATLDEFAKSYKELLDKEVKGSNYGLVFGANYKIKGGFYANARYNLGLANMVKNPATGEEMKMSFLQVGVGYRFLE